MCPDREAHTKDTMTVRIHVARLRRGAHAKVKPTFVEFSAIACLLLCLIHSRLDGPAWVWKRCRLDADQHNVEVLVEPCLSKDIGRSLVVQVQLIGDSRDRLHTSCGDVHFVGETSEFVVLVQNFIDVDLCKLHRVLQYWFFFQIVDELPAQNVTVVEQQWATSHMYTQRTCSHHRKHHHQHESTRHPEQH